MEYTQWIPTPDTIPAPWWLFDVLGGLTFLLHILLVNIVFGAGIVLLFSRITGSGPFSEGTFSSGLKKGLPTVLALAITLGIAPLLFIQVVYGHFFYTSSIVIGQWWMIIIPFLMLGYAALYLHQTQGHKRTTLAVLALVFSLLMFLYLMVMWVGNVLLHMQPALWAGYFANASGTLLPFFSADYIPRFLHFLTATIAVGGLALAVIWWFRDKNNTEARARKVKTGMRIFAFATIVQILAGFWWLIALPREIMLDFMGQSMPHTIVLAIGVVLGLAVLVLSLLGKLWLTVWHLAGTLVVMVTMRWLLKQSYMAEIFDPGTLEVVPQYDVLALFLVIFVVGLGTVYWMLKMINRAGEGRAA
ncbi:hypothetical protein GF324_00880 [bacterium]|nr:hypothetical protein [bacterium]